MKRLEPLGDDIAEKEQSNQVNTETRMECENAQDAKGQPCSGDLGRRQRCVDHHHLGDEHDPNEKRKQQPYAFWPGNRLDQCPPETACAGLIVRFVIVQALPSAVRISHPATEGRIRVWLIGKSVPKALGLRYK